MRKRDAQERVCLIERKLASRSRSSSFLSEQQKEEEEEEREDEEEVLEPRKEKRKVKDVEKKDEKKRGEGFSTKEMTDSEEGMTTPRAGVHTLHQEGLTNNKKKKNALMPLGKKKQKKKNMPLHSGRISSH